MEFNVSTPVALSRVKLEASSPERAKVNAVVLSSTPVKVILAEEFSSKEEDEISKSVGAALLAAEAAIEVTFASVAKVIPATPLPAVANSAVAASRT